MNKILSKYQQWMGAFNYAVFMLLIFTLPFPWSFTQPICVVWLVAWILEGRWVNRANWRWSKGLIPFILIGVLIAWNALSLLWSSNVEHGIADLNKYLTIMAALTVGVCGVNDYYKPTQIKTTLVVACLVSVLAYCLVMISFSKMRVWVPGVTKYYLIQPWTLLGEPPVNALKHRLYYGLSLALALSFSGDLFHYYKHKYSPLSALLTIVVADLILIVAIVLTGSRTMMLIVPVIVLLFIIRYLSGKQILWSTGSVLMILMLIGGIFMKHNTRITKTIEQNQNITYELARTNPLDHEPRIYIHGTILRNWRDFGYKGLGCGTAPDYMIHCYEKDQLPRMIQLAYGPHSQFLNTWIELGPMAMIFLIFILCYSPFCYRNEVRWSALLMTVIMGAAMLTETCLARMSGIYNLTAMFILLLIEDRQQMTGDLGIRETSSL